VIPLRDVVPSRTTPYITITIIALNALAWLFELSLPHDVLNEFIRLYGVVPASFDKTTLVTSMFLHGSWSHVLGNMWYLWIFGDNVEDRVGHGRFIVFYLLCGIVAALGQVAVSPHSTLPTIGASGAIAGVMGAYLIKFPHARILTLIPIIIFWTTIEIPAAIILVYWFILQFFSGIGSVGYSQASQGGGVAFFAHVGGFVAGMVLVNVMGTKERYSRRRDLQW
jgi:membrane associated rhomboid family serine protease